MSARGGAELCRSRRVTHRRRDRYHRPDAAQHAAHRRWPAGGGPPPRCWGGRFALIHASRCKLEDHAAPAHRRGAITPEPPMPEPRPQRQHSSQRDPGPAGCTQAAVPLHCLDAGGLAESGSKGRPRARRTAAGESRALARLSPSTVGREAAAKVSDVGVGAAALLACQWPGRCTGCRNDTRHSSHGPGRGNQRLFA